MTKISSGGARPKCLCHGSRSKVAHTDPSGADRISTPHQETLKRSPPQLWLITQTVTTSNLEDLVQMQQSFLDVAFRHGHVEWSIYWISPVSLSATRNADFTSTIVILKRRHAISCRIMARLSVERVGLFLFFVLRHFTSCVPSSLSRRKSTGRDCRMCSATLDRCNRECWRNTKTNAPTSSTSDANSFLYLFSVSRCRSGSANVEL